MLRTHQPGTYETYGIKPEHITRELRAIRKAGGFITRSSPVGSGYRVTVFWAE